MSFDPFADEAPADEAQATPQAANEVSRGGDNRQTPTADVDREKNYTTVILKGGAGYGAPSVSIRGANIGDALAHMEHYKRELVQLLEVSAKTGNHYARLMGETPSGGQNRSAGQQRQPGKPEGATQAPNGESRYCKHGEMPWKSGTSKAGKTYAGWFCTGDRDDQCEPQWPAKR